MKLYAVILQCDVCVSCRMKFAPDRSGIIPFLFSGRIEQWAFAAVKGTGKICAVYTEPMGGYT